MIFPQQELFNAKASHIISPFQRTKAEIRPHFHVTSPSGSGKSFLIKKICDELEAAARPIEQVDLT